MSKKRVYEIAKDLNIDNKELLSKLETLGVSVKNHMSTVDEEIILKLKGNSNETSKKDDKNVEVTKTTSTIVNSTTTNHVSDKIVTTTEKSVESLVKKESQQVNNSNTTTNNTKFNSGNKTSNYKPSTNTRPPQANTRPDQSNTRPTGTNTRPTGANTRPTGANTRPTGANTRPTSNSNTGSYNKPQSNNNRTNKDNTTGSTTKPLNNNRPNTNNSNNKLNRNKNVPNKNNSQQTPYKQVNLEQKKQKNYKKKIKEVKEVEIIEDEIKTITLTKDVTVKQLADALGKNSTEIIMILINKGIMANINQVIDFKLAVEIAESFDVLVEEINEVDIIQEFFQENINEDDLTERPPVVVVMGHVDHGKTSLLDYIRKTKVITGEAGGITQHIGAYTVEINGKPITFLDTPGHEAFTAMRMRGASVTDIAILVVAADDGVMPQTIEAINHAKAAKIDIIVAINKIDKPNSNSDRVKQELTEHGILVEEWGGENIAVPVSALTGEGVDTLLEMINLTSEIKELKAVHDKNARGTVIEACLDKGRGSLATVLVQSGTLKIGDPIVIGHVYGKVRAMIDDTGKRVKSAGPSIPVEILGLSEVPKAGDSFYVAENEKQARQLAESITAKNREDMIKDNPQKISLDDLFNQIQLGTVKDLNIVVKADVQGSVEAIKNSLEKLSNEEVRIKIIHGGVGAITETDVMLASASNAIIIGFNVRPDASAKSIAENEKVDLRLYRVIYNAIDDIASAMKGLLDPIFVEKVTGHAEVRQIFKASGIGTIGGSYVLDGKIYRSSKVRVVRDGIVVYEGDLGTLKRFKDDVKEVNAGYECGILVNKFNDLKENDIIEAYQMEEVKR